MRQRGPRVMESLPLIQHGGLSTQLQQAFGIHGKVAAHQLGDVVHPVTIVSDLTQDSWYSGAQQDKPCATGGQLTAGAGNMPFVSLFNPSRDIVILVELVGIGGTVNGTAFLFGITAPGTTQVFTPSFRDFRTAGVPVGQVFEDTPVVAAAPVVRLGAYQTNVAQNVFVPIRFVCGQNQGIGITIPAAVATLTYSFIWREHAIIRP